MSKIQNENLFTDYFLFTGYILIFLSLWNMSFFFLYVKNIDLHSLKCMLRLCGAVENSICEQYGWHSPILYIYEYESCR